MDSWISLSISHIVTVPSRLATAIILPSFLQAISQVSGGGVAK